MRTTISCLQTGTGSAHEFAVRTFGLSPFLDPRRTRINLISGRRCNGRTTIPPTAARAQEDETILDDGI
jgi:hypothetical protein